MPPKYIYNSLPPKACSGYRFPIMAREFRRKRIIPGWASSG